MIFGEMDVPFANEILQELNEASEQPLGFPNFATWFPIDVRLSAYRDHSDWALVIEVLVFNDGPEMHECIRDQMFCYGSALSEVPGRSQPDLCVTSDGPSGPLFGDLFDNRLREGATDMRIRDKVVPITTDRKVYQAAGVLIKWPRPPGWYRKKMGWKERTGIHGAELLRLIVPKHRKLFFATEAEILKRIGKRMPLLLRLDEWYHADDSNHERPSDSESYQLIAECISRNDPGLYKPTVPPNTHWRSWPQAGII